MPADAAKLQANRKQRARNSLLYIMKRKLGQNVGEDEVLPEFVPLSEQKASPVCKIEWDAVDKCIYTGDEGVCDVMTPPVSFPPSMQHSIAFLSYCRSSHAEVWCGRGSMTPGTT